MVWLKKTSTRSDIQTSALCPVASFDGREVTAASSQRQQVLICLLLFAQTSTGVKLPKE